MVVVNASVGMHNNILKISSKMIRKPLKRHGFKKMSSHAYLLKNVLNRVQFRIIELTSTTYGTSSYYT
jgi:hypothetical protein